MIDVAPPSTGGLVYLVDDEPGMLVALTRLLQTEGFTVRSFSSARDFLAAYQPTESACLVLDVAMPDQDGFDLQQRLSADEHSIPIIFLTGHGDIPMCVRAIKSGAQDFLTKPVDADVLLGAIRETLAGAAARTANHTATVELKTRLATLTAREREVMEHVVAGKLNREIAADLGTQVQTIKIHRMRMMEKMACKSVADLVRAAQSVGVNQAR